MAAEAAAAAADMTKASQQAMDKVSHPVGTVVDGL